MLSSQLLSTLLLVLTAVANPVVVDSFVTLPISKKVNFTGARTVLDRDIARVRHLRDKAAARLRGHSVDAVTSSQVTNLATTYVASVGVGSPATTYSLLVDTGSSNTWVGAGQAYVRTSTSVATGQEVEVTYGSGDFEWNFSSLLGNEFLDQVTIAPGLVIPQQSIGVATSSEGFEGVDGILGIGPTDLTLDTLSPDTSSSIPTVTDNLFSQGTISADQIGISFEPTSSLEVENGEITWGGTDSTKFTGSIIFTEFWGINQSIKYGTTTILSTTAGIVDTGTTLLLLASNAFSAYTRATGAVTDETTGLLRVTTAQFNALESLTFTTSGGSFVFTANAQLWPRALNTAIGGRTNLIYLIVGNLGTPSGEGFDFVNGFVFLERFYSVFDTANKQVGFATTSFTDVTTN
ncbi:aspartic peptidase A1 [Mycena maculata]|uniref:Aspartic peptidase A1 n=1 Tax=Mycena maculata TaxID=230809 RepID=A0AAD7NNC5_9AGAR|nr:aspartic peptidase A1 [Mycena maculata]